MHTFKSFHQRRFALFLNASVTMIFSEAILKSDDVFMLFLSITIEQHYGSLTAQVVLIKAFSNRNFVLVFLF